MAETSLEKRFGSNSTYPTTPQRYAVPTQSSYDIDLFRGINDVTPFVPLEIQDMFYGFANNLIGLGKFTPRQAEAAILDAKNIVNWAMFGMHPWEITTEFILKCENFIRVVTNQVNKATTLDQRSERHWLGSQATVTETHNPGQAQMLQKKGFLRKAKGLFG